MNIKGKMSLLLLSALITSNLTLAAQTQSFSTYTPVQQNVQDYGGYSQQPYYQSQYSQPQYSVPQQSVNAYVSPLQASVVMIPAYTTMPAVTTMEYDTSCMALGQNVSVVLPQPFMYNGMVVAPAGSMVQGTVIQHKSAQHGTRNGMLQVKFTNITTPYGQSIPISGRIKTDDGSGIIYGGTKVDTTKEYVKDMGVGAAVGAVAGLTMGALSGGKVGKGAAYGTAVGAGGGLVKSLWDRGGDVVIPANSAIEVMFDQPVTYTPMQYR